MTLRFREWYHAHREQQIARVQAYYQAHREELLMKHKLYRAKHRERYLLRDKARHRKDGEEFSRLKGEVGCEKCGIHDGIVIEFHHINPREKLFGIHVPEYMSRPLEELIVEIGKCQTLCANCHRRIEWEKKRTGAFLQ